VEPSDYLKPANQGAAKLPHLDERKPPLAQAARVSDPLQHTLTIPSQSTPTSSRPSQNDNVPPKERPKRQRSSRVYQSDQNVSRITFIQGGTQICNAT